MYSHVLKMHSISMEKDMTCAVPDMQAMPKTEPALKQDATWVLGSAYKYRDRVPVLHRHACRGVGMSVGSRKTVSLMRKFAFLFLALAVFGLGLQARLALYKANPNLHIASAKLSKETQSATMLKSIEVQRDDREPSVPIVFALLLSSFHDSSGPAWDMWRGVDPQSNPIRSQMTCVTFQRRPPPTSL